MQKYCFVFFFFFSVCVSAQQVVYDMSVLGFSFGEMVVTRTIENDSTELYTLNAKGKTNFLWMKREDETIYQVRFRNGKLLSSTHKQMESGVTSQWTKMLFDGKTLHVDSYKGKKSFTGSPDFSVLQMYFKPLQNRAKVFHEAESEYVNLVYRKDGTVEMKIANGSKTIYRFANGKIAEMEVHLPIATVHMKLLN